jgi:CRISP-associated protein Cas1
MRLERVIAIDSPCSISIDLGRLAIKRDGVSPAHIALVDMCALVLESPRTVLTGAVLQSVLEHGIAVIVCGATHVPCGLLFPNNAHVATVTRQRLQASFPQATANAIWDTIVRAKINNQRACLERHGKTTAMMRLKKLGESVKLGDHTNCEAQAAQLYWPELFGKAFRRGKEGATDDTNVALNYGYAILRALVARYVALAGLSPVFGVGHDNKENPLCLVDDLMEPFRPTIDAQVIATLSPLTPWGKNAKAEMLRVLDRSVLVNNKSYKLSAAVWELVQSFARVLEAGDTTLLVTPEWLP